MTNYFCSTILFLIIIQEAAELERAASSLAGLTEESCQQLAEKIAAEKVAVDALITEALQHDQPTGDYRA